MKTFNSILSAAAHEQKLRPQGRIRPGIKELTNKAKANQTAVKIYEDGVKERLKYSEIEKKITDATGITYPLYPKNTEYFSISKDDFGMPEVAECIINRYGESRNGGPKRLYRFPIVFHSGDLNEVFPNSYKCYTAGGLSFESDYDQNGCRVCKHFPIITQEDIDRQKALRIKRMPPRQKVSRGICSPIECKEYLEGLCKFKGTLMFYIPNTPAGLLGVESSSHIASLDIWNQLETISRALGEIPRTSANPNTQYIFYLTKMKVLRRYYDENGKKHIGEQWVVALQSEIDVGTLLMKGAVINRNKVPTSWQLPGNQEVDSQEKPMLEADGHEQVQVNGIDPREKYREELQSIIHDHCLKEQDLYAYFEATSGSDWFESLDALKSGVEFIRQHFLPRGPEVGGQLLQIWTLAKKLKFKNFREWAFKKFGENWMKDTKTLEQVKHDLAEFYMDDELFRKSTTHI